MTLKCAGTYSVAETSCPILRSRATAGGAAARLTCGCRGGLSPGPGQMFLDFTRRCAGEAAVDSAVIGASLDGGCLRTHRHCGLAAIDHGICAAHCRSLELPNSRACGAALQLELVDHQQAALSLSRADASAQQLFVMGVRGLIGTSTRHLLCATVFLPRRSDSGWIVRPPGPVGACAPACASRCLRPASTTARASTIRHRSTPVAR